MRYSLARWLKQSLCQYEGKRDCFVLSLGKRSLVDINVSIVLLFSDKAKCILKLAKLKPTLEKSN